MSNKSASKLQIAILISLPIIIVLIVLVVHQYRQNSLYPKKSAENISSIDDLDTANYYKDPLTGQLKSIQLKLTKSTAVDQDTAEQFDREVTQNNFASFFKAKSTQPNLVSVQKTLANSRPTINYSLLDSPDFGPPRTSLGKAKDNYYTYADVFPDIDLRFTVKQDQLLEEFIVHNKKTAAKITVLSESFSAKGLKFELKQDGSIDFTDINTHELVFQIPKPVMYELDNRYIESYGLHYEVIKQQDQIILSKIIDEKGAAWLADPKRQYPVAIDATTVDTSTSSTPTAYSFQRKTWYDGTRYWSAFHSNADDRIEFWYSSDGSTWTENTSARISVDTHDFSVEANSANAFIAYTSGDNIVAAKATSYPGTGFSWTDTTTALSAGTGIDTGDGHDGAFSLSTSSSNLFTSITLNATSGSSQTYKDRIEVASTTGVASGDDVLVIQMTGTGQGNYEFCSVESIASNDYIDCTANLANSYLASSAQIVVLK